MAKLPVCQATIITTSAPTDTVMLVTTTAIRMGMAMTIMVIILTLHCC